MILENQNLIGTRCAKRKQPSLVVFFARFTKIPTYVA